MHLIFLTLVNPKVVRQLDLMDFLGPSQLLFYSILLYSILWVNIVTGYVIGGTQNRS